MRTPFLYIALLATTITSFGADGPGNPPGEKRQAAGSPICRSVNEMSLATGQPSLVILSSGSMHVRVWLLPGGTAGKSVAGLVGGLPSGCGAVKVEIVVTTNDDSMSPDYADVNRAHVLQLVDGVPFTSPYALGTPVRTALCAGPFYTRTILLDPYHEGEPNVRGLVPGALL